MKRTPSPEITPVENGECSSTEDSVDNTLSFEGAELGGCEPIDRPCDASGAPENFQTYNKGPTWKFEFGIVDEEGLVPTKYIRQ